MSVSMAGMGACVGFLVGLTGVGAASLLTPLLVLMGIHPTVAVGTDLVYNSVTKLFGVARHLKQKTIEFTLVKNLATGSIPGAVIAILLLHLVSPRIQNADDVVKHFLGYVLVLAAAAMLGQLLFAKKLGHQPFRLQSAKAEKWFAVVVGFVLGFLVGLTSIGSGSLFALVMLTFYPVSASRIVGTDLAHAFLLTTVAGALNLGFGHVDLGLVLNLLLGSIPGVLIGSTLSAKLPTNLMRAILATLIFISGLQFA